METSALASTALDSATDVPGIAPVASSQDVQLRGADGRIMTVGVDYMGVLPEGAFPPETDFAKVFSAEVRDRCVSTIPGIEKPFRISSSSLREIDGALEEHGVPEEIRAKIAAVIGNAPKCEILERFLVSVSNPNPSKETDGDDIRNHIVDGTRPRFENGICPDWRKTA